MTHVQQAFLVGALGGALVGIAFTLWWFGQATDWAADRRRRDRRGEL